MAHGDRWDIVGPLFNAHLFALSKPAIANAIDDAFVELDLTELTRSVLNETAPQNRITVIQALDDFFGDLGDDPEDGDE